MHPDRTFAWKDEEALRAFVRDVAFAQLTVAIDGVPHAAHAPLAPGPDGSFRFHLARANPLVPRIDGARLLATIVSDSAYISPDWYGTDDQVPTWNYRLVEISGLARRLDDDGLVAQLETLSAVQEARLAPKKPWTRDKMRPGLFDAMVRGIVGFTIEAPVLKGLAKLGQNKSTAARAGVVAALRAIGRHDAADAMEEAG